jgi:DNA-binding CsgD family transcriptional regulator
MLRLEQADGAHGVIVVAIPMPSELAAPLVALLLYEDPGYRELSAPVLRELYGFTRAELNLVQSLAHGQSLEEGAQQLGISVNTARTHLKHIFHKTGAKRQSELIHQVETGPAVLPLNFGDED